MRKRLIFKADNLLTDLNEIADLCIGNEKAEDVGYGQRTTYPELLAYVMINPGSDAGVKAAITKQICLEKKVEVLGTQLRILLKKIKLKNKIND